jgi:diguanylate cyclase (GGDEF)-like protein
LAAENTSVTDCTPSMPDAALAGDGPEWRLAACLALADPAGVALPEAAQSAAREAAELARSLGRHADERQARAWLCSQLLRLGRHAELLAEAPAALALLHSAELAAERRELLRLVALSGSEAGAHDTALDAAHELVRLTAGLRDDGAALSAAYGLAVCFERMGDSWQANRMLQQALDDHGAGAPDEVRLMTLTALCAVAIGLMHRLRGADSEGEVQAVLARARDAGEQARALLMRCPSPTYEVSILGNLGEVLLHQGEVDAAQPLLHEALALAQRRGLPAHAWRIRATLGDWLLARGDAEQALQAMQSLIADSQDAAPQQTVIRAHHAAYAACRALGRHAQALAHFEVVERTERRRATAQLRAQSQLFVTRTESQQAQWQAEQARLEAQRQRARAAEFAETAERDPLTGLGNRRHLTRRCAELLPVTEREGRPLAIAQIDVDHFKRINDRHGHAAGDRVLVGLAQLLRDNTRNRDVLVRHGGEEFVLVMPGMSMDSAAEVCQRLRVRVAGQAWGAGAQDLKVTISIGLAAAPSYELGHLLHRADEALYRAKRGGRNRVVVESA